MEPQKNPEQAPSGNATDETVSAPPAEAVPATDAAPSQRPEADSAGKAAAEPAKPGTNAGSPAPAQPKEPSNIPVGFIVLGSVVLVVLLVLAFIAYSKQ